MKQNRLPLLLSIVTLFFLLAACKKQDNWQTSQDKPLKVQEALSAAAGSYLQPEFLQVHQAGAQIKIALLRPKHSTLMGFSYSFTGTGVWLPFDNYTHPANGGLSYNEGIIDDGTWRWLETYEMPIPNAIASYDIKADYMIMDHENNTTIFDSTIFRGLQIGALPPPGTNPAYQVTLFFIMNYDRATIGNTGSMSMTIKVNDVIKASDTVTWADFDGEEHLQRVYTFISDIPEGSVTITTSRGDGSFPSWSSFFSGSQTFTVSDF